MASIDNAAISAIKFDEGSAPSTPSTNDWKLYFKTDGMYIIDDAGVEHRVSIFGGSRAIVDTTILADTPMGFWKCDESSVGNGATLADSSGNGYTLTISGSNASTVPAFWPTAGASDTAIRVGASTTASAAGTLGFTPPVSGDYTLMMLMLFEPETTARTVNNASIQFLMSMDGGDETEANNMQFAISVSTSEELTGFWEYSTGTNEVPTSNFFPRVGVPIMVHLVKDGTANTITVYVNGRTYYESIAYSNEPTGGSTSTFSLWGISGFTIDAPLICGPCAVWGSKLTAAQIADQAAAAGLLGAPA